MYLLYYRPLSLSCSTLTSDPHHVSSLASVLDFPLASRSPYPNATSRILRLSNWLLTRSSASHEGKRAPSASTFNQASGIIRALGSKRTVFSSSPDVLPIDPSIFLEPMPRTSAPATFGPRIVSVLSVVFAGASGASACQIVGRILSHCGKPKLLFPVSHRANFRSKVASSPPLDNLKAM